MSNIEEKLNVGLASGSSSDRHMYETKCWGYHGQHNMYYNPDASTPVGLCQECFEKYSG